MPWDEPPTPCELPPDEPRAHFILPFTDGSVVELWENTPLGRFTPHKDRAVSYLFTVGGNVRDLLSGLFS